MLDRCAFSQLSDKDYMSCYFGLLVLPAFNHCFLLQGWENAVDTTALVRSCVQSAVGMLRDQVEGGRSTRRVEILLTLLSDNDEVKGTNNTFLSLVLLFLQQLQCS